MLIKRASDIASSEITPQAVYMSRRDFIAGSAAVGGSLLAAAAVPAFAGTKLNTVKGPFGTDEKLTPLKDITNYNNFYEYGTDKYSPAAKADALHTRPWTVKVEGHCKKPKTYDVDEIMRMATLEERVYRLRCVEGWSMVIPWVGFPFKALIDRAEPTSKAKYLEFTTLLDPGQMPNQRSGVLEWPYVEGLRMDEALHPLAILCFGLYGEVLPNQNGAPIRIITPWKYGFKSIKSLVKIRFVETQPQTAWMKAAPNEYGFYSNVNPTVDHPRWSQAKERRIGEFFKRSTLTFNGYAEQVQGLYSGMDLRKNF